MKLKIIKDEEYKNVIKRTVEITDNNNKATERFSFSHKQIKNGLWKDIVIQWFQNRFNEPINNKSKINDSWTKKYQNKEIKL